MRHACEAKVLGIPQCKGFLLKRDHEQEAAFPCVPVKSASKKEL